jgi:hypothetical protein
LHLDDAFGMFVQLLPLKKLNVIATYRHSFDFQEIMVRAVSMFLSGFARLAQIVIEAVQTFKSRTLDRFCASVAPCRRSMRSILVPLLLLICEENLEELVRAIMTRLSTMSLHSGRLLFCSLSLLEALLAETEVVGALTTLVSRACQCT